MTAIEPWPYGAKPPLEGTPRIRDSVGDAPDYSFESVIFWIRDYFGDAPPEGSAVLRIYRREHGESRVDGEESSLSHVLVHEVPFVEGRALVRVPTEVPPGLYDISGVRFDDTATVGAPGTGVGNPNGRIESEYTIPDVLLPLSSHLLRHANLHSLEAFLIDANFSGNSQIPLYKFAPGLFATLGELPQSLAEDVAKRLENTGEGDIVVRGGRAHLGVGGVHVEEGEALIGGILHAFPSLTLLVPPERGSWSAYLAGTTLSSGGLQTGPARASLPRLAPLASFATEPVSPQATDPGVLSLATVHRNTSLDATEESFRGEMGYLRLRNHAPRHPYLARRDSGVPLANEAGLAYYERMLTRSRDYTHYATSERVISGKAHSGVIFGPAETAPGSNISFTMHGEGVALLADSPTGTLAIEVGGEHVLLWIDERLIAAMPRYYAPPMDDGVLATTRLELNLSSGIAFVCRGEMRSARYNDSLGRVFGPTSIRLMPDADERGSSREIRTLIESVDGYYKTSGFQGLSSDSGLWVGSFGDEGAYESEPEEAGELIGYPLVRPAEPTDSPVLYGLRWEPPGHLQLVNGVPRPGLLLLGERDGSGPNPISPDAYLDASSAPVEELLESKNLVDFAPSAPLSEYPSGERDDELLTFALWIQERDEAFYARVLPEMNDPARSYYIPPYEAPDAEPSGEVSPGSPRSGEAYLAYRDSVRAARDTFRRLVVIHRALRGGWSQAEISEDLYREGQPPLLAPTLEGLLSSPSGGPPLYTVLVASLKGDASLLAFDDANPGGEYADWVGAAVSISQDMTALEVSEMFASLEGFYGPHSAARLSEDVGNREGYPKPMMIEANLAGDPDIVLGMLLDWAAAYTGVRALVLTVTGESGEIGAGCLQQLESRRGRFVPR